MSPFASVLVVFLACWHSVGASMNQDIEDAPELVPRSGAPNIFSNPISIPNPQIVSFAPVAAPSYAASVPAQVSSAGGQYYSSASGQYYSSGYGSYASSSQPRYQNMPTHSAAAGGVPSSNGNSGGRRPIHQQAGSSRSSSSSGSVPTNAGSVVTPLSGSLGLGAVGIFAIMMI